MINIQEIILGILILVCMAWIIRRTILCFKRIKKGNNPCEGCPLACNSRSKKHENKKK